MLSNIEIDALNKEADAAMSRNIADARRLARKAHEGATSAGYRRGELWSLFHMAHADALRNEPDCSRTFRELIDKFREIEEWSGVVQTLLMLAGERLRYGAYEEPVGLLQEAIEIAREHAVNEGHSTARRKLGQLAFERREFASALEHLQESVAICERANLPIDLSLNSLAGVYHAMKEYDRCEEYLLKSLHIAESRKNLKSILLALGNLGIVAKERGEFQKAIDYQTRALQISERLEDLHSAAGILALLPSSYIALGRFAEAEMAIQKLLAYVGRSGNPEVLAQAYRGKAELQMGKGHFRRAIEELRTAEGYAYQTHLLDLQQEIATLLGKAHEMFRLQIAKQKQDAAS